MSYLFSITRKQRSTKTPLVGVAWALILFASLVGAPRVFAQVTSPTLPSLYDGDWNLVNGSGTKIDPCSIGVQSYKEYENGVLNNSAPSFLCAGVPWVAAANLNGFGTGDVLIYDFFTGTSYGGTNIGHITLIYGPSGWYTEAATTTTSIISTLPHSGEVTGSQTFDVGGQVYVAPNDYKDDEYLYVEISSTGGNYCANSAIAIDALDCFNSGGADPVIRKFSLPLTSAGTVLLVSTSTTQKVGLFDARYSIRDPYFFGLFYKTLVSTTTMFTVSTTTPIDNVILETRRSLASTTLTYFANCNPLASWDFMQCLSGATTYLFKPNEQEVNSIVQNLHDNVLTRVPFGYITRFVTIMASSTAEIPPAITYTFGSSSPVVLQGQTISLQPYDSFDEMNSIKTDQVGEKSLWDVVDPIITLMVQLSVLTVIFRDLLKLTHANNPEKKKVNPKTT